MARTKPTPGLDQDAAEIFVANESFYDNALGITVIAGQSISSGHPVLAGKPASMFRPFEPVWPWPLEAAEATEPAATEPLTPVTPETAQNEPPAAPTVSTAPTTPKKSK